MSPSVGSKIAIEDLTSPQDKMTNHDERLHAHDLESQAGATTTNDAGSDFETIRQLHKRMK